MSHRIFSEDRPKKTDPKSSGRSEKEDTLLTFPVSSLYNTYCPNHTDRPILFPRIEPSENGQPGYPFRFQDRKYNDGLLSDN